MSSSQLLASCRSSLIHRSLRHVARITSRSEQSLSTDSKDDEFREQGYQRSFDSFWQMVRTEKADAKNFILIEDRCSSIEKQTSQNLSQLLDTQVDQLYKYRIGRRAFSLVKLQDYSNFTGRVEPAQTDRSFPIRTRMLILKNFKPQASENPTRVISDITKSKPGLDVWLRNKDVDEAANSISSASKMTQFGSKLRFFFLNQIEEIVCNGALSDFRILPFGSSVNGFGSDSSDLDMVMDVRDDMETKDIETNRCLSYQSKPVMSDRFLSQRLVDFVGDYLQYFMPGIVSLQRIPRARVPIVKVYSDITGLDSDISFQPSDASVRMAEILFDYSLMDERIAKLICFIKIWAKHHSLTNQNPGPWYTNFMLMMMVVHFFQTRHGFQLPSINDLKTLRDRRNTNSNEDTSFAAVLREFFEFVSTFDYENKAMSLLAGKSILKPTHAPIYIENPTEPELNICVNVKQPEVRRLVMAANTSLALMLGPQSYSLADLCRPTTTTTMTSFANNSKGVKGIKIYEILSD